MTEIPHNDDGHTDRGGHAQYRALPGCADALVPPPQELVDRNGTPGAVAWWKAVADGLPTEQSCAFHRNVQISSCNAWIYQLLNPLPPERHPPKGRLQ